MIVLFAVAALQSAQTLSDSLYAVETSPRKMVLLDRGAVRRSGDIATTVVYREEASSVLDSDVLDIARGGNPSRRDHRRLGSPFTYLMDGSMPTFATNEYVLSSVEMNCVTGQARESNVRRMGFGHVLIETLNNVPWRTVPDNWKAVLCNAPPTTGAGNQYQWDETYTLYLHGLARERRPFVAERLSGLTGVTVIDTRRIVQVPQRRAYSYHLTVYLDGGGKVENDVQVDCESRTTRITNVVGTSPTGEVLAGVPAETLTDNYQENDKYFRDKVCRFYFYYFHEGYATAEEARLGLLAQEQDAAEMARRFAAARGR